MKRIIHKCYFIWEYEKEEQWLNEMAAQGWNLTDASLFRYVFEEGTPGEYVYRLEMMEHWPNHPESVSYIRFMEETGAQQVASVKNWVYFRRKTSEGSFDLFSDLDSRIRHLDRIHKLALLLTVVELPIGLANLIIGVRGLITGPFHLKVNFWMGLFCIAFGLMIFLCDRKLIGKPLEKLRQERAIRE